MTDLERWGIQPSYRDTGGELRRAPDRSVRSVLASLQRGEDRDAPAAGTNVLTCRAGDPLPERWRAALLTAEDGTVVGPVARVPPDLPIGYHHLDGDGDGDGDGALLIVSPGVCHLPAGLRSWGWAVQLYAARSTQSWGMGDLADAVTLARWSRARGGDPVLMLNPLHAVNPTVEPEASPYFAGSRCFRNPIYLRIEDLPVAAAMADDLEMWARAGRALNAERRIDRRAVLALKRAALDRLWTAGHETGRPVADAAMAADPVLAAFGAHSAAVEIHGDDWRGWPARLRHPGAAGWGAFEQEHADRIAFHVWVQGLMTQQVAAVEAVVKVVHDLAIGTDRQGFDAWYWQDLFVLDGTEVGAPPDQFNTGGQGWGLPPLDPWRLRAAGFEPFVRMVRAALECGSGLRLDHVMGLFRLFWIPPGTSPAEGLYVRQPARELLDVLALESVRAGAFAVGEDLGTVETGVRAELDRRCVLAYRVLTLDPAPPSHLPELCLASPSTHDLPTIAGLWSGTDLDDQRRLGMDPNVADTVAARAHLRDGLGVADDAPVADVVVAAHRALGVAPCQVVVAQLEDAALVPERPNMPGTVDDGTRGTWPNWALALPRPLETLLTEPTTLAVAEALVAGRGSAPVTLREP